MAYAVPSICSLEKMFPLKIDKLIINGWSISINGITYQISAIRDLINKEDKSKDHFHYPDKPISYPARSFNIWRSAVTVMDKYLHVYTLDQLESLREYFYNKVREDLRTGISLSLQWFNAIFIGEEFHRRRSFSLALCTPSPDCSKEHTLAENYPLEHQAIRALYEEVKERAREATENNEDLAYGERQKADILSKLLHPQYSFEFYTRYTILSSQRSYTCRLRDGLCTKSAFKQLALRIFENRKDILVKVLKLHHLPDSPDYPSQFKLRARELVCEPHDSPCGVTFKLIEDFLDKRDLPLRAVNMRFVPDDWTSPSFVQNSISVHFGTYRNGIRELQCLNNKHISFHFYQKKYDMIQVISKWKKNTNREMGSTLLIKGEYHYEEINRILKRVGHLRNAQVSIREASLPVIMFPLNGDKELVVFGVNSTSKSSKWYIKLEVVPTELSSS